MIIIFHKKKLTIFIMILKNHNKHDYAMTKKYNFLYKIPKSIQNDEYHHNENVIGAAANVIKKFIEYDEVVTIAEMQSGKTDVMKRLIYIINKYNDEIKEIGINIDKYNIYLIICASSINLKNQLKTKLPEIRHKIFHLNDVATFLKNLHEYESLLISMADSSLIIFDECHCDAEQQKLIDKFRTALDSMAKINKTIYHKVGFSATPYEQVLAKYPKVIMEPGKNYYGMRQIFDTCRPSSSNAKKGIYPLVFQAKKLSDPIECENLFSEIDIYDMYYIFRLPGQKNTEDALISNIEKAFKKRGSKLDTFIYDMSYKDSINSLLDIPPKKPTVIYLKDKLRMGEYLNTKYVYLVHDDPLNTYAHTTAQSLIGRCCGYNKRSHQTIIYCDFQKAWQHYEWIEHKYDTKHIPPNAKYICKKDRRTKDICIY